MTPINRERIIYIAMIVVAATAYCISIFPSSEKSSDAEWDRLYRSHHKGGSEFNGGKNGSAN